MFVIGLSGRGLGTEGSGMLALCQTHDPLCLTALLTVWGGAGLGELSPNFTSSFYRLWLAKRQQEPERWEKSAFKNIFDNSCPSENAVAWKSVKPLLSELVHWEDLSQDLISYTIFQVIPVIVFLFSAKDWVNCWSFSLVENTLNISSPLGTEMQ